MPPNKRVPAQVVEQSAIADLAREVLEELAPGELGMFQDRCRAYFPRWGWQGRHPLAIDAETWGPVVTFAVLNIAQAALVYVAAEFGEPPLTGEQLAVVRDNAYEQAIALKLPRERATALADAITARLAPRDACQ